MEANITDREWRKLRNDVNTLTLYIIGGSFDPLDPDDAKRRPLRLQVPDIQDQLTEIQKGLGDSSRRFIWLTVVSIISMFVGLLALTLSLYTLSIVLSVS